MTISDTIQLVFSFIMLLITGYYAFINNQMLKEMRILRQKSEDPDISINLIRKTAILIDIEIKNISNVPIYDLRFLKYPILEIFKNYTTEEIGILSDGISYMDINQKYSTLFLNTMKLCDDKEGNNVSCDFDIEFYKEPEIIKNRTRYKKVFSINANIFIKTQGEDHYNYLTEIDKSIKEIIKKNR